MAKSNRICFLCGKKYSYCNTCGTDINKPSWYTMWCSENCKNLDQILAAHTMKQITTEEAKKKIEDLKLNNVKFADENVEKHYNEIMSYNVKNEEIDKNNKSVRDNESIDNDITSKSSNVKTISKAKVVNTKSQNDKKK